MIIDGAAHFPWVEQPTAFRRAVGAFVTTDPIRPD